MVFRKLELQNVIGHRVDSQKALPYVTTRVLNQSVQWLLQWESP